MTTVTFSLLCDVPSRYCIEYNNGTLHDVFTFELIVVLSAIAAIFGYVRASVLYQDEHLHSGDGHEGNSEIRVLGGHNIPSIGSGEGDNGGHVSTITETLLDDNEADQPSDTT
jgi:hypothetical protein